MSVGALAYDSVPLSSAAKLDYFSPEFQSLVTDKGAMILHMLRWVVGEKDYLRMLMREFAAKYAGKPASTDDFREIDGESVWPETDLVLSPSGWTQPARRNSKPSTRFIAWVRIKGFESSGRLLRI